MMNRSFDIHQMHVEATSKIDHFLLGGLCAACAYLAQSNVYGRIGINPETLSLISLLTLSLAAYFAHKRVNSTARVLRFNVLQMQYYESGDQRAEATMQRESSKYADLGILFLKFRNALMYVGFLIYLHAKVWAAYS